MGDQNHIFMLLMKEFKDFVLQILTNLWRKSFFVFKYTLSLKGYIFLRRDFVNIYTFIREIFWKSNFYKMNWTLWHTLKWMYMNMTWNIVQRGSALRKWPDASKIIYRTRSLNSIPLLAKVAGDLGEDWNG